MFGSNQGYKIIITYFFHCLFIIGGNPPAFSDLWKFKMILDKSSLKNISCKFDNCQYILIFLILDLGFVDWKNSWSKHTPCSLMDVWAISLYVELFSCAQLLYFMLCHCNLQFRSQVYHYYGHGLANASCVAFQPCKLDILIATCILMKYWCVEKIWVELTNWLDIWNKFMMHCQILLLLLIWTR